MLDRSLLLGRMQWPNGLSVAPVCLIGALSISLLLKCTVSRNSQHSLLARGLQGTSASEWIDRERLCSPLWSQLDQAIDLVSKEASLQGRFTHLLQLGVRVVLASQ